MHDEFCKPPTDPDVGGRRDPPILFDQIGCKQLFAQLFEGGVDAEGVSVWPWYSGGNESDLVARVDEVIEGAGKVVYEHPLDFVQRQIQLIGQVESRAAPRGNVHLFIGGQALVATNGV